MSLREDMWKYEQITGESAEHVPIIKLGAFLDGYDMGIKALEQQPSEDCISREAVKEMLSEEWTKYMPMELDINLSFVMEKINELRAAIDFEINENEELILSSPEFVKKALMIEEEMSLAN